MCGKVRRFELGIIATFTSTHTASTAMAKKSNKMPMEGNKRKELYVASDPFFQYNLLVFIELSSL